MPFALWSRPAVLELFESPQLNPDERLNAGLKHALGSRVALRTKPKLKAATEAHMKELEQNPERIRAFFQDPRVKYAV